MIEVSVEPRELFAGRDCELKIRLSNTGTGTCTDIVFKAGLPPGFLLLRGQNRVEIPKLRAGEAWVHKVTVQPRISGDFTVTSTNFSYRNEYGTPTRVPEFRAGLTVLSGPPPSGPDLGVEVVSGPLAPGEWDVLTLRVRSVSTSPLRGLGLVIDGPVQIAAPGPQARLPDLATGQAAEVSFIVCPAESGSHVPAHVRVTYDDGSGRTRVQNETVPLVVRSQSAEHRVAAEPDKILFLAASPTDLPPLRSDKEMREIHERLQLGKHRDRFRLESAHAVRLKDIGQALADYEPRIVHFAGHGRRDGSLHLEDENGDSVPAAAVGLAELFGLHADTIECVIVNACDTLLLAQAISRHINHVIAMRYAIGDAAAITFSIGFYQGLAAGAPIAKAFARGRALLLSQAQGRPEHETPVLIGPGGQVLA